jgi:LEA14-like dessication related protein
LCRDRTSRYLNMKKALVIILAVLLILGGVLFGLFYFKPKFVQNIFIPEIEQVGSIAINVKGDTAYTDLLLELDNKGPFRINIDSIEYHVMIDTIMALSRLQHIEMVIGSGEQDTLHVPLKFHFKKLIKRIVELQERDSLDITTEARVVYKTVLGNHALPHKKTNRIGMPRPPKFDISDVKFKGLKKGVILFEAKLTMENPGALDLLVSDLSFDLKLADLLRADGHIPGEVHVKPRSVMSRHIPIEAHVDRPLRSIFKLLSGHTETPYQITLRGFAQHEKLGDEKTEVVIVNDGTVDLRKLKR